MMVDQVQVADKLKGRVVMGSLFEVNYIINLSPNHTLQLTTLRERSGKRLPQNICEGVTTTTLQK